MVDLDPSHRGASISREQRDNLVENVKMLVLQHGVAEASRISGVKYKTVKTWAYRYRWIYPAANTPQLQPAQSLLAAPSEILRTQLLNNKSRSTLALSSYLAKTSESLDDLDSEASLKMTKKAKDLGDLHGRLYPPQTEANSIVNIAIVTGQRTFQPAP